MLLIILHSKLLDFISCITLTYYRVNILFLCIVTYSHKDLLLTQIILSGFKRMQTCINFLLVNIISRHITLSYKKSHNNLSFMNKLSTPVKEIRSIEFLELCCSMIFAFFRHICLKITIRFEYLKAYNCRLLLFTIIT